MGCPTALELALVPVLSMVNLSMGGLYSISQLQGRRQLMSYVVGNHEKWHDDWSVRRAGGCHSAAQAAVEDIRANKKTLPRARARLVPGSDGGGSDGGGTGR